jgi:transposase
VEYYIGLDVSQRETSICVVDHGGRIAAEGKTLSQPRDIHAWPVAQDVSVASITRVGLEAGALSNWLCTELSELGLPMVCLETFQAAKRKGINPREIARRTVLQGSERSLQHRPLCRRPRERECSGLLPPEILRL